MEALLGRVARLGAGVAGAAFVGNNFLFNGASRPVSHTPTLEPQDPQTP